MVTRIIEGNEMKIPNHLAIIMDGNGRWAKSKNKPRKYGHSQGSNTLEQVCKDVYDLGVKYLTVYAFSTENWNRPEDEINALMDLLRKFLKESIKKSKKNNMRVKVIGTRENLDKDIIESINQLEEETKDLDGLTLLIALNYGSRNEIIRAIKKVIIDYDNKKINIDEFKESMFDHYLDTQKIPDPDLLIRTSGEKRISNFLLWQLAYTEFYFTEKFWPDFNKQELIKAIIYYNQRERRFGKI